jgi:predicted nucleic acid-binding protein
MDSSAVRLLDTSVIVRYLMADQPQMQHQAAFVIESDEVLGITSVAVLESAHVLSTVYRYPRDIVVDALTELITRDNMVGIGVDRDQMVAKLSLCRRSGTVSFGDALLAATAVSHRLNEAYTFDAKLRRSGLTALIPSDS